MKLTFAFPLLFFVVDTADNLRGSRRMEGEPFSNFCWKDSSGRGGGEIPSVCDSDKELLTPGLCYDNCPIGMKRVGTGCHSICPEGYEDQGLFCRKPEYVRDVGTIPATCPAG
mmetsp:Transcript_13391/g.32703  ORF Transcript_13391/g.32703 Transcript_13391/m.32703 type:complete len:113 (+) Transcript_13391:246-584(+)